MINTYAKETKDCNVLNKFIEVELENGVWHISILGFD